MTRGGRCRPGPSERVAMAAARFFGRSDEKARFAEAMTDARAGRLQIVLISGLPGIGKTRLAAELSREAEIGGFTCVSGSWREDIELPEFWIWRHILARLLEETGLGRPGSGLDSALSELAAIIPEIRDSCPGLPAPMFEAGTSARLRLFDAACRILRRASGRGPLLLLLDNLHLAGEASLEWVTGFAEELGDCPVFLLCAFRRPFPAGVSGFPSFLGSFLQRPDAREYGLQGLAPADAASLLESELGTACDGAMLRKVLLSTKGHPLYVREAGRLCRERYRSGASSADCVLEADLPRAVAAISSRRLGLLSAPTRAVLSAAALVGEHFTIDELEWAAAVADRDSLEAGLEEAAAQGFLEGGDGDRRFSHAVLHEAIRVGVSEAEARGICLRLAATAERAVAGDRKPWAFKLAAWWSGAGGTEGLAKAREYTRMAADSAMESGAWEQAAELYRRLLGPGACSTGNIEEADLHSCLGRALFFGGRRSEATSPLKAAFDGYRAAGNLERMIEIATLPGYLNSGDPGFFDFVGELLKSLPPGFPATGTILHFWGVTQFNHYGDYEGAERTLREAESLGGGSGDIRLQMTCRTALAFVYNRLWRFEEARRELDRAKDAMEGIHDLYAEMHYNVLRYQAEVDRGAPAEAVPFLDRWIELAHLHRDEFAIGCSYFSRARIEFQDGNWSSARRFLDSGLEAVPGNVFLLSCRCHLEYMAGNLEAGDEYRGRLLAVQRRTPTGPYTAHMHAVSTAVARALQTGDAGDLRGVTRTLEDIAAVPEAHPFILFRVRILAALVAALLADETAARRAYRELLRLPRVYVVHPYHLERAMGLAAHAFGDHKSSAAHLRVALRWARHYGDKPVEAWILLELGGVLISAEAANTEYSEARRVVIESREAARRLGMPPLEARARKKLEELTRLMTDGKPGHAHLTPRERQMLKLVEAGLTNKAIAGRLGISVYTVVNHLRHIMEKTGTVNRTEAVIVARRLDQME